MRKLTQQQLVSGGVAPLQAVGSSVPHESAGKQVAGEARFVDDYPLPFGCLHAAVITAPVASGKIVSDNFAELLEQPGVQRIVTIDDVPGHKDIGAVFPGDKLLSGDEINYDRQPVALLLADSHEIAWRVASTAKLEVEEAADQVVITAEQAISKPHLMPSHTMTHGDAASAMAAAAKTVEGCLSVGGQEHFYLEGQVSLAEPTEDRGIMLYTSSQHPTEVQKLVAEVLDIPFNLVTVDMRRMGGGFGGKETQAAQWACLASLAAWLTKKPVKLRLPRSIDMAVTGKRHPFFNSYRVGIDSQGKILGSQIEVNGLCGYSPDLSAAIVDRAMFHSDNAYSLGDAQVTGNRLKTDTVSHTAFRGFGGPQGMITIEKAMQDIAIATGRDSLDVRYSNLYNADAHTTHYGMEVTQHEAMRSLIEQLEQNAEYRERREQVKQWNQDNPILKKGLALTPIKFGISFTAKHLNQAGALIHIYTDGSIQVNHGGTEMGQGLHTKVAQIVAQTLGVPLEFILVTATRTDKVPNTSPTAASSGTDLNGMAAHNAAKELRERLIEFAAEAYQLEPQQISIENGQVVAGEQTISWSELVQEAYMARVSLSAKGFYKTPKIWYDRDTSKGQPFYYFALGASCSEVTIDTLTGEMVVDRVDILHDVGQSINPALDIGQIEGAFIQGMGWLTTEELKWDKSGRLMSFSPATYKIPTIGDYPKQMNITLFDQPNPENSIYRSKAVGEPPFMLGISVWCAVYDAVASLSSYSKIPQLDAPATSEAILFACMDQLATEKPQEQQEVADATV